MGIGKGFLDSVYIYIYIYICPSRLCSVLKQDKTYSTRYALSVTCIIVLFHLISLKFYFSPKQTPQQTVRLLFSTAVKHFQVSAGKYSNYILKNNGSENLACQIFIYL